MKDSQEQLKVMSQQMDELALEKAELEARNKILKHVVRMNADCIDRLQSRKVTPTELSNMYYFFRPCYL